MKERWKKHPIYDCEVSDQGRVQGIKHMLTPWELGVGYLYVAVRPRGGCNNHRTRPVHTLVLETFVGPRPNGHDPDHIDKDIKNNWLTNLRWLTIQKNRGTCKGKLPGNAKLKEGEVWLIRKLLKHVKPGKNAYKTFSQRTIAKMFPVISFHTIADIANGHRYKGVGYDN